MTRAEPADAMTRGRLLAAAGAAAAGAFAFGARHGDGVSLAAPRGDDAEILAFFLTLEQVQEDFYRHALEKGRLDGELRRLASTVAAQEHRHVRVLLDRLGDHTPPRARTDFSEVDSPEAFLSAAVELEEAAIAGYIGQSGNLSRGLVSTIARLASVEARQVAWLRSLTKDNPAPRAADPPRKAERVLAELRQKGWLA